MKIGILLCGYLTEKMTAKYHSYSELFAELLDGEGFEFTTYDIPQGELPQELTEQEGYLITGSRWGAYEDHDWIPGLEKAIRAIYKAELPMIGICFGHQIMAQALGGKVEKFSGGWNIGTFEYSIAGLDAPQTICAWHQDQVVEVPADATIIASRKDCEAAALQYKGPALSYQAHPEFSHEFLSDLFDARREILPTEVQESVKTNLTHKHPEHIVRQQMAAFFKQHRKQAA